MWTKGLPLLSSPPFSFLASFDYSFAPRRASRIPFPPLSFFSWMGLGEPRKTLSLLRRARVVLILSGGLPPLLLHCRSTFTSSSSSPPLLPSTNCFFSINFVFVGRVSPPRAAPTTIASRDISLFLSPSSPTLDCPPNRTWLLFLPKNCTVCSLLVTLRSSTCQFLRSPSILDINRIFSRGEGLGGACFRCYKLILIGVYDNLYGSHSLLLRDEESLLNFDRDTFLYLFSSVEGNL